MQDEFGSQRRHTRVDSALEVRLSTIEPERDPWTGRPFFRSLQERTANVSRGGLFVRTQEPLSPGRRVLVECRLPTGRPVEAIGRVAWTQRVSGPDDSTSESGVGIEFLGGAGDQWSALEEFVAHFGTAPPRGSSAMPGFESDVDAP